MPRIPLTFGLGLDRETGTMAMTPGGMEDLRNVHLLTGKFQVQIEVNTGPFAVIQDRTWYSAKE